MGKFRLKLHNGIEHPSCQSRLSRLNKIMWLEVKLQMWELSNVRYIVMRLT